MKPECETTTMVFSFLARSVFSALCPRARRALCVWR
jgi:hypothetical protein